MPMDGCPMPRRPLLQGAHTRMPLLTLGVGIAEPLLADRAVHCRWITARLIGRRHPLTQATQVRALRVFFFHRHTSCRYSTRDYLKCIRGVGSATSKSVKLKRPARARNDQPVLDCAYGYQKENQEEADEVERELWARRWRR
jgi:hypothetical protein